MARYKHRSSVLGCDMHFHVFHPKVEQKAPVVFYLSGLTCTDLNVIEKGFAQRWCSQHGLFFVAPDTSPRGLGIPGEDPDWDFGTGAGMYVDATNAPWSSGYKMYSYITQELPQLLSAQLPLLDTSRMSITGHSMGGHGALLCALKNPGLYKSVSAFAPICNSSEVPWGIKTFTAYLGEDKSTWKEYDACHLASQYNGPDLHLLVDQGTADKFLEVQLSTAKFEGICKANPVLSNAKINMRPGYDHGYYFVSTFMEEHIAHHANFLKQ
uniref:S-formylglutathione hydrolase n=1 Tax=Arcella intermedia TaxID=1963864 RepID=A0A6B2LDL0_9EUKA